MSELAGWIGKTETSELYISPEQANHMAVLLDHAPNFKLGDDLPAAWHWLYMHELIKTSDLSAEGHPKRGILMPPITLPGRMRAGGYLHFQKPLQLGDTVTQTSTITAITPKQGRSGALCFVNVAYTLTIKQIPYLYEDQLIVYREHTTHSQTSQLQHAPVDSDYSQQHQLNSMHLFRYSALTWNAHRIHYDLDYCRNIEGYPDLVVHGPLIATLLLDLYCQYHPAPSHFRYRAYRPLFVDNQFTTNSKDTGQGSQLWVSDQLGQLAMEAEAS